MNILAGMAFGAALALVLVPLLPQRPRLRAVEAAEAVEVEASAGPSVKDRVAAWALRVLPEKVTMSLSAQDLDIVGVSRLSHTWSKIFAALLMGVGLLAISVIAQVVLAIPLYLTLLIAAVLVALAWVLPDVEVQTRAKTAREEFGMAVAVFVELLAAERRRDAPTSVALENAASVSNAWPFRRIRQELLRATYNKVQPWTALERLSVQLSVPELGDSARVMALSGERGAAVYEPLRALGKSLRVRMLNTEAAREAQASDKMTTLLMIVAMMFVVILLVPMLLTLMS